MVAIITLFRSTSTWTFPPAPAPATSSGIPVHSRKQVLAKGKWHIFSLGSFGPDTKSKGNLYLRVDESGTQRQRLILRERTSGNASGHAQEMLAPPSVPQMPRLLKKTNVVDNYSQGSALGFRCTGMWGLGADIRWEEAKKQMQVETSSVEFLRTVKGQNF